MPTKVPADWPVQSRPPTIPAEASALRPGPILQEYCNGHDIYLKQRAVAEANIAKERGHYLIFLPGILSLKKDGWANYRAWKNNENNSDNDNLEDTPKPNDDKNDDEAQEWPSPTKSTSKWPPHMGKIVGLKAGTPMLKVPFPGGKTLIFPGKFAKTSSKYIMLQCSRRVEHPVSCKNIFSSAIVFGKPTWEAAPLTKATTTSTTAAVAETMEKTLGSPTGSARNVLIHYGGSVRTVDGGGGKEKAPCHEQIQIIAKNARLPHIGIFNYSDDDEEWKEEENSSALAKSSYHSFLKRKREPSSAHYNYASPLNDDNELHQGAFQTPTSTRTAVSSNLLKHTAQQSFSSNIEPEENETDSEWDEYKPPPSKRKAPPPKISTAPPTGNYCTRKAKLVEANEGTDSMEKNETEALLKDTETLHVNVQVAPKNHGTIATTDTETKHANKKSRTTTTTAPRKDDPFFGGFHKEEGTIQN